MATIDELIVRLDADLMPLEAKLKRAERLMAGFSSRAERALGKPSAQMAALVNPRPSSLPGNKTSREELRVAVGESGVVPTQAAVVAGVGKILLDITVSVGTGLASNFILDTFLSNEFKPQDELFERDFDVNRIQQAFFEFQARSEDLAKAAEDAAIAEDRILKELGSVESQRIAEDIRENLQEKLNEVGKDLQAAIDLSLTGPENEEERVALAANASTRAERARRARGEEGEPTPAEVGIATFEEARKLEIDLSPEAQMQLERFADVTRALETVEGGVPDEETLERIARAREAADPVQRLEVEVPEGLGNVCDCIRDLFNQHFGSGGDEQDNLIQTAGLSGTSANAFALPAEEVEKTSVAMQGLVRDTEKLTPALVQSKRETIELNRVARDLGFTFSSALEDAIVNGEKFSEILQGLERDILRILTRTLITEPIAEGIRGGIQGDKPGAGGLEGLLNKAFGTGGLIFGEDEPEQPTITRVDSEIADQATTSLLALGDAGDTTGALLAGSLSEGALEAGVETLTQAGAASFAATQLSELGIAAGGAAAALQALVAAAGTGGGGSDGGGGLGGLLDLGITAAGFAFGGPGGGAAAASLGPQFTGTGSEGLLASGSFASGGIVSGPGGSRSDSIPALLSDGEFVVNARAARTHRRLLEAVNKGNRLRGLDVFRDGGLATTGVPGIPPIQRGVTVQPQTAPDVFMRPIVVNINNPTNVPEIQRNMAQIRGSLRQMLDRAQRRGE